MSGKKKGANKGKGKEKAQTSANILSVPEIAKLDITTAESINFSCYEPSEKVEWCLDSGCTEHITPSKSDFVEYREFNQAQDAEIADGKYLTIEGHGTIVGYTQTPQGRVSIQLNNVLYVPEACKRLFSLIVAGQRGSVSETTGTGTTVSKNGYLLRRLLFIWGYILS